MDRPRELNGAEALMGFLCWLTTRELPVTLSRSHDASIAVELMDVFSSANRLGTLGDDWPACVVAPEPVPITNQGHASFKTQLERFINRHSLEGGSDTPDFLLADYLVQCLALFDVTIAAREQWYGRHLRGTPAMALPAQETPQAPC